MMNMNSNNNKEQNNNIMKILGSLDKNKIEQVTKMVQNMSSEDLNNLAKMFGVNNNNNK